MTTSTWQSALGGRMGPIGLIRPIRSTAHVAHLFLMFCLAHSFNGAAAPTTATAVAPASNKPNILWISCEDMSPDLGCYGDREARTPNLDKLAADGARFTHA